MQDITIALIQADLAWESVDHNLSHFSQRIAEIGQDVDLVILPEMFSTGFTMEPQSVAEGMEGAAVQWMADQARKYSAVITGSLVVVDKGRYYNRMIWMPPDGKVLSYDKKHLFSYAGEDKNYSAGSASLVATCKGWKIRPVICYDLRFPVWCRNRHTPQQGFDYDCLLFVANWPAKRSHAWRVMLMSRAIENMCYVVGVNRIGTDNNGIEYSGDSALVNSYGESVCSLMPNSDKTAVAVMSWDALQKHRERFQVHTDWDHFTLQPCPSQP